MEPTQPRRTEHAAAVRTLSARPRCRRIGPRRDGPRRDSEGRGREAPEAALAFVAATVTTVAVGPDGNTFQWDVQAVLSQPDPAPRFETDLSTTINSGVGESSTEVRSEIAAILKNNAFNDLQAANRTVPEDRIAVALL